MRNDEELRRAIAKRFWFHSIELRPGIVTPGSSGERFTLPHLLLPEDMTGMSVLDIGCWDGFFSFECERRGAKRIVSTDVWESAGRDAFDLAREELRSKAEPVQASVYDLPDALNGERFDLVLFLGVLYHLKHPLLALEQVAACTAPDGLAVIETLVDTKGLFERPVMAFYPGAEVNGDPTTWWAPNIPCLSTMLQTVGFSKPLSVVQVHGGNRTIFHATKASDAECAKREQEDYQYRHRFRGRVQRSVG